MALDTNMITSAALKLLNEVGLDALSTRRLAAALNIRSPSLYKHFASKAELLDQMATAMLMENFSTLRRDVGWEDWLRSLARASRAALLRHRDGARLLVTSSPSEPRRSRIAAYVAQPLVEAGFDYSAARHAVVVLSTMVEGWVLNEQNDATRQMMVREMGDLDQAFEEAVEVVVMGVRSRRAVVGPHAERRPSFGV